jgi:hypothetical protein
MRHPQATALQNFRNDYSFNSFYISLLMFYLLISLFLLITCLFLFIYEVLFFTALSIYCSFSDAVSTPTVERPTAGWIAKFLRTSLQVTGGARQKHKLPVVMANLRATISTRDLTVNEP